jgi:hypothetical protein
MFSASSNQSKRLVYVVPYYVGYRISSFKPLMNDMVAIDWQLRLLSYLKSLKIDVYVKQHPESSTRMPPYFFEEIGVIDLQGSFEDSVRADDICIFDHRATTAFGAALKQNNPIVFINFGTLALHAHERASMHRRLIEIDGFYDDKNRANIELEHLGQAIDNCQNLNDRSFLEIIYGAS